MSSCQYHFIIDFSIRAIIPRLMKIISCMVITAGIDEMAFFIAMNDGLLRRQLISQNRNHSAKNESDTNGRASQEGIIVFDIVVVRRHSRIITEIEMWSSSRAIIINHDRVTWLRGKGRCDNHVSRCVRQSAQASHDTINHTKEHVKFHFSMISPFWPRHLMRPPTIRRVFGEYNATLHYFRPDNRTLINDSLVWLNRMLAISSILMLCFIISAYYRSDRK